MTLPKRYRTEVRQLNHIYEANRSVTLLLNSTPRETTLVQPHDGNNRETPRRQVRPLYQRMYDDDNGISMNAIWVVTHSHGVSQ